MSNSFGELIRSSRKAKKLTLEKTAKEVGISTAFLSRLERGEKNATEETLKKIAGVLEIPEKELLVLAGYISTEERRNLVDQLGIHIFSTVLFKMNFIFSSTLKKMEESGIFKDHENSFLKYPGNLVAKIHVHSNKIPYISSSPYSDFYDAMIRDQYTAYEAAEIIAKLSQEKNLINIEDERLKINEELDPYYKKNETYLPIIETIPFESVNTLSEAFGFTVTSAYRKYEKKQGLVGMKVYDFPINDIFYHLSDSLNDKLYKDMPITLEDREVIIEMINAYLLKKYINDDSIIDKKELIDKATEVTNLKKE